MSIVRRYVIENTIVKRFLKFIYVTKGRNAEALAAQISENLLLYNCEEQLVAQTYDGAAVMSRSKGGVQAILKKNSQKHHLCTAMPIK